MNHKVNPRRVPRGYAAMTWFPWLAYYRSQEAMTKRCKQHEAIHGRQQAELLIILFYLLYGLEYLYWRWIKRLSHSRAYLSISFEREARKHDWNPDYLKKRKIYSFWRLNSKQKVG